MARSSIDRPPISISVFGRRSVIGRMRKPRPAASTIACRGRASADAAPIAHRSLHRDSAGLGTTRARPRQVAIEPTRHLSQRCRCQCLLEQPPDTRDVAEIAELAISLAKAREDADHLGVPLRRQHVEGASGTPPQSASAEHRER